MIEYDDGYEAEIRAIVREHPKNYVRAAEEARLNYFVFWDFLDFCAWLDLSTF